MSRETSKAIVMLGELGRWLQAQYSLSLWKVVYLVFFKSGILIGYQHLVDIGVKKSVKGMNGILQAHT